MRAFPCWTITGLAGAIALGVITNEVAAQQPKFIPAGYRVETIGIPRSIARRLIGHKTESIFTRYAVVSSHDLGLGTEKLAALGDTIRHSIGIEEAQTGSGAPVQNENPAPYNDLEDSEGGTRTPDTRIMIPCPVPCPNPYRGKLGRHKPPKTSETPRKRHAVPVVVPVVLSCRRNHV